MNIIRELEDVAALNLALTTAWLSLGLFAARVFRAAPIRAHWVLFLAIAGCLVGPALHGVARSWNFSLSRPVTAAPIGQTTVSDTANPNPLTAFGGLPKAMQPADRAGSTTTPAPSPGVLPLDSSPATIAPAQESARSWPWKRILTISWLSLSTALTLRLLVSLFGSVVVLWRSKPLADSAMETAAKAACRSLNLRAWPVLRSCETIDSPAIWCWYWRPVLLIPKTLLSRRETVHWESLLCHELSHWRRRDHVTSLISEVALIVFPCQPLLWMARRQLRRLCELACDAWVIVSGYPRRRYAETLLDLIPHRPSIAALSAVSSKNDLRRRLDRIVNGSASPVRMGHSWAWGVSALFVALGLGAALIALPQTAPISAAAESPKSAPPKQNDSSSTGATARRIETGKPRISYGRASVSPDGRYLAGSNYRGDFYILDIPANKKTKLFDSEESFVTQPVWSADSRRLLLSSLADLRNSNSNGETSYETLIYSLDTGKSSVFLQGKRIEVHDWSPDGKTVVATTPRWESGPPSVFLISTETKEETRLDLGGPANVAPQQRITFSPDGKLLLYAMGERGRSVLHVRSLDGSLQAQYDEFLGQIEDPMWSDDGRHVLFVGKQGGSVDLLGVRFENNRFVGFPILIKPDAKNVTLLNPIKHGQLAYRHYFEGALYTVEMNPETAKPVGKLRRVHQGGWTEHGWSPDGKKIARMLRPTGEDYVLGIVDATHGQVIQQLPLPGINMAKVGQSWWKENSVVIGARGGEKPAGLYEVRLDTGAINLLMPQEGSGVIWYHSIGGQNRVAYGLGRRAYVYDLAEKKQLLALPKEGDSNKWMIRPAISADGKQVTYQKGSELWIVSIDDGRERLLFDFGKMNYTLNVHSWAPNGKYLSVIAYPKGSNNELWMLPTSGGEPFQVPLPLEIGESWFPQWSPDGKQLAIHFWTDEEFQYWILSNYMPESSRY